MLDQHLVHIGHGDCGIDRLLGVAEKFYLGRAKGGVGLVRLFDFFAQGPEHGGQIGFELLDRFAELRDLRPLIGKEKFEKALKPCGVIDRRAQNLLPVLNKNGRAGILENDVILRIAPPLFLLNFFVQIVVFVLRLPIAQGNAQRMKKRAVNLTPLLGWRFEIKLGDENEIVLLRPILQQILERLAHHAFAIGARDAAQTVKLVEELVDKSWLIRFRPANHCTICIPKA